MTHFVIVSAMTHQFQHITQIMAGKTWEAKLCDQLAERLLNFKRAQIGWMDLYLVSGPRFLRKPVCVKPGSLNPTVLAGGPVLQ